MRLAIQGRTSDRPHPRFSGSTMLGIGALVLLLSAPAQTYGFSVFIDPMLAEFGWSRSLISTAYTVATLASAGAVFLAGGVIDRFGQRRVMLVTAVVYVAALLTMGTVSTPLGLLLGFTLLRITGSSVLTLAARTLVAQWFVQRRGRAVSVLNLGKTLGMAAVPPVSAFLIERFGWRSAWQANALLVALLVPLIAAFVRGRPEEVGQFPDGRRPDDAAAAAIADDTGSWTLRQALRTRTMWLVLSTTLVPALVTNGLSFNQISILTQTGLTPTVAATTFAVESIVALPVTLLAGWMADRFGPRALLALGQATLTLAMVALAFTNSPEMGFVFGALRGLSSGTWILASEVTWPAYFGRRYLGSIVGLSFTVAFVGAAVGPLPFGLLYDAFGTYDAAIWALTILPFAATWAALLATPPGPPPTAASRSGTAARQ